MTAAMRKSQLLRRMPNSQFCLVRECCLVVWTGSHFCIYHKPDGYKGFRIGRTDSGYTVERIADWKHYGEFKRFSLAKDCIDELVLKENGNV